ncbi:uncharacterized protein [Aegilops tauschii subsp. strangulata]|uniref:uncharacterized protein n=1 Tax=Aegilops tauschii subsp. strangulata TaxID=200361 RepID=UPI003CC8CD20
MEKLALDPNSEPQYTMKDGILRYKGRVWIGNDATVQQHLINSLHSSAVGGHSGFHATYNRIKRLFAWHGMKAQIKQSGLPRSGGYDTILVVVDKFSRTPFEVIYGQLPREFGVDQVEQCSVPDLAAWLREREIMIELLQQQLKLAQDRMKRQADKHRTDKAFEVGDAVLLKLQPFIQSSVAQRPHQKLAFRYFGPYRILARIGAVAYKLDLPASSKIHPVVHVSQLKKAEGAQVQVNSDLPPDNATLQAEHIPAKALELWMIQVAGTLQPHLLIQWSGLPEFMATWEEPVKMQQRFPATPPWGQGETQEGEDVTAPPPGRETAGASKGNEDAEVKV